MVMPINFFLISVLEILCVDPVGRDVVEITTEL